MTQETLDLNVLAEITQLDKQIRYHANLFFNKDTSEISDSEYDTLVKRFDALCEAHPDEADALPGKDDIVPIDISGTQLTTRPLVSPMMTLKKAFTQADMNLFYKTLPENTELVYEYKLDGVGLEIHYCYGKLDRILTRGNGVVGEDITHMLDLFDATLFEQIDASLEAVELFVVRGEAIINDREMDEYIDESGVLVSNNRNTVSEHLRRLPGNLDPLLTQRLSFYCYWCDNVPKLATYTELSEWVEEMGFCVPPKVTAHHITNNVRTSMLPLDGIVAKVDDLALREQLGERAQSPRWAIAYKLPPLTADTRLLDVVFEVGRTGYLTPIAIYAPVNVPWLERLRANLFNYRFFIGQGLRIGSVVTITEDGDIMPKITRVVEPGNGPHIKIPKNCPSCGSVLSHEGESKQSLHLRCTNVTSCPAQFLQRVLNFVDATGFGISYWSPRVWKSFIATGCIRSVADVFKLPEVIDTVYTQEEMDKRKVIPLNRFIKALSLPGVGVVTASALAHAIGSKDVLAFLMDADQLVTVEGIGPGAAFEIADACAEEEFVKVYHQLMDEVTLIPPAPQQALCKVIITGTSSLPRAELEQVLSHHNVELTERVTKDCKFILVGHKASSAKVTKATKYGIGTIDLSQIKDLKQLVERILA